MSNSKSFAVAFNPSMFGFLCTLAVGGLFALTAPKIPLGNGHASALRPATQHNMLVRLISKPEIEQPSTSVSATFAPSRFAHATFAQESVMSRAQLIGRWDNFIGEASQRFQIPAVWIRAVMAQESGGRTMLRQNKPIVSRAGAVGLMQILPGTYERIAATHSLGRDPSDAHDNIMAGAAYLQWLHSRYGFPAMFAAYNAGPGRLQSHLKEGASLPAETRAYVGGITKNLKLLTGTSGPELIKLTRPDGSKVKIDPSQVTAIRAARPGEYAPHVKSVIMMGKNKKQGIRENVQFATKTLWATGKHA